MTQIKKDIVKEVEKMYKFIKGKSGSIIEKRIAYAMAEVLRWSILDTLDWDSPLKQAKSNAKILELELGKEKKK